MGRVFIVQESPGKDLLSAADYGEVRILLPPERQVTFSPGPVVHDLDSKLSDFSDSDYLVLVGDPVAIGIACAVAARWNNGRFNVLKWDRFERRYYPIRIELFQRRDDGT